MALEEAAQRSFRRLEPNLLLAPGDDRLQRQVRLGAGELQEPIGMRLQRRTGLAAARPWRYPAGLFLEADPTDRRRDAHLEPLGRLPPRRAGRHLRHHALPQIF